MNHESNFQCGHVSKIIRVMPNTSSNVDRQQDLEGYGLIRSLDGREVFFVAAALSQFDFASLRTGAPVRFTLEPGPFNKVAEVWPEKYCESVSCLDQPANVESP